LRESEGEGQGREGCRGEGICRDNVKLLPTRLAYIVYFHCLHARLLRVTLIVNRPMNRSIVFAVHPPTTTVYVAETTTVEATTVGETTVGAMTTDAAVETSEPGIAATTQGELSSLYL